MLVARLKLVFCMALTAWFTACTFMLPYPDVLHEDLVVPLGKIDGSRRYFHLQDIQQLPGNYEAQEYFVADFRGNDVELIVNWEKQDNSLTMVASATAGQPIFAIRQEGRQLVEQQSYFDLKGLKFSWLLADYQLVHLPLNMLSQVLAMESVAVVEVACAKQCEDPSSGDKLLRTRYLLSQSLADKKDLESAQMIIQYYTDLDSADSALRKIKVINARWHYHYTISVL